MPTGRNRVLVFRAAEFFSGPAAVLDGGEPTAADGAGITAFSVFEHGFAMCFT
jgi:hypothetical protein